MLRCGSLEGSPLTPLRKRSSLQKRRKYTTKRLLFLKGLFKQTPLDATRARFGKRRLNLNESIWQNSYLFCGTRSVEHHRRPSRRRRRRRRQWAAVFGSSTRGRRGRRGGGQHYNPGRHSSSMLGAQIVKLQSSLLAAKQSGLLTLSFLQLFGGFFG